MSKKNPPKNRDFLGLVKSGENVYWIYSSMQEKKMVLEKLNLWIEAYSLCHHLYVG